jgi:hypothetical protein
MTLLACMNDLDQVEQKIADYRSLRPEHKDFKLYPGFSVPQDVVKEAHKRGLFVLKRSGDMIEADTASMKAF